MLSTITQALRRGDAAAALSAARAAVNAEPDNPQVLHLLGLSLQKTGDMVEARSVLDRAIELAPTHAGLHLSRGNLEFGIDSEAAKAALQQAVVLNPNQGEAYVALVHLALAAGDSEEAARQLKLAERVDADAIDVRLAAGCLAQAKGDHEMALREFTAAVTREPKNAFAQLSLGLAYFTRGLWPFAEQALKNALALQPENSSILRTLVLCQLENEDPDAALATLDGWLRNHPGDPLLLTRAQILVRRGMGDLALADYQTRLSTNPADPLALRMVTTMLLSQGQNDAAIAATEAALAHDPARDEVWQMRLSLPQPDQEAVRTILERWLAAMPNSALAWDRQAQMQEELGELDAAEVSAQNAVGFGSQRLSSHLILFRAQLRRDPAQALATIDLLLAKVQAAAPEMRAMLATNRGLALDRIGRYGEAADCWRNRPQSTSAPQMQLPAPRSAENAPTGSASGVLLWAPVGVPLDPTFAALQPILGRRLCLDRIRRVRGDGFDARPTAATDAGSAESWRHGVMSLGQAPEDVVDWLPYWDTYTGAALSGARVLALLIDPRDAFVNWMVFGSVQPFPFLADSLASANWLAQTLDGFATHLQTHPDEASVVMIDDVVERPAAVAEALKVALALPTTPDPAMLGRPLLGSGELPMHFPPGHWRHYQEAFAAQFACLTPVALRLGYPA
jgi:tetratricopeptide (TPR) repeat protein